MITIVGMLDAFCDNESATLEINDGSGTVYCGTYRDFVGDLQNEKFWTGNVGGWSVKQNPDGWHFDFNIYNGTR